MIQLIKNKLFEIHNRFKPKSFILMYHRVSDLDIDPWKLAVSAKNFEEQLKLFKKEYTVISLEELIERKIRNKLEDNTLVITFDDGYKDNYTTALPILNKYKLPATFFINSAYIESGLEFWHDKLVRLLLNQYELPIRRLEIAQIGKYWDIYHENEHPQLRFNFFMDVWYSLLQVHPTIREEALKEVEEWSNHDQEINPESLPMSKAEFMDLANQPLVTIGAHTDNHAALGFLDIESQRQEIKANKIWLEKNTGNKITGFSYPNGSFNKKNTITLLKEMNFKYACTTKEERHSHFTSNYKTPRFQIHNWDEKELRNQIKKW